MSEALKYAWIFYSALIALLLVLTFILPAETILNNTPVCSSLTETGNPCAACGLSNGFVRLSHGKINVALKANKYSLMIYTLFMLNTLLFSFHIYQIFHKKIKLLK